MKLIKCKEHKEIFELVNETKHWIENWDTFMFLGYDINNVEIIPFDKLKSYKIGFTRKVTTVTRIDIGEAPDKIFYPDEPEVEIRKISILGTCLPGCETMMKDLNFTHAYGNRYYWPDHDEVERLGMKSFINIHDDITENGIREIVNEWKDRPGCGGYWSDTAGGHEPDITSPLMDERIRFYNTVRKYDLDIVNHPVMEMFDLTEADDFPDGQYQGWRDAYNEGTLDLLLFDCYVSDPSDEKIRKDIMKFHNKFTGKYCKNIQVIPQLNAFKYRPGSIRIAYETWKEILGKEMGIAYYKDETVRRNEEMQREIQEVNEEVIRG